LDKQAKGKLGLNKESQKNKKHSATNPSSKVKSLKTAEEKIGDEKESKAEKKQTTTTQFKLSSLRFAKKKIEDKKKKKSEDESVDAKPKRKKRVIRIDPYDISNKRLDDGNVLDG